MAFFFLHTPALPCHTFRMGTQTLAQEKKQSQTITSCTRETGKIYLDSTAKIILAKVTRSIKNLNTIDQIATNIYQRRHARI